MKRVQEYIYKDISSVSENSTIRRVIKTMRLHRVSTIPVVNKLGEYAGCITEEDVLEAAVPEYMKSMYNTSFMADLGRITSHLTAILDNKIQAYVDNKYPYVTPKDSMSYAADLLHRSKGNILPVIEGKTVLGLITRIEILSASLED